MPIQGNLRDFSTTQLLNLINLSGRTGALRLFEGVPTGEKDAMQKPKLAPGKPRAEVYFRSGKLVYANLSGQHGDLIAVLNKSGKLNDNQARVMRDKAKGTNDKALALRLIGANYVTKNDVVNSVQQYILSVVYDIMTWSQEIFRFDEGLQASDERILVPIDLEHVIIEGARRLEKIEEITQHIENLDMCLRFPENPKEKLEGIQLSVEEWRVVSYVSPKNTIRQIAKQLNMGEIEIRRIVYGLEQAGIVEIVRPQVDGKARATAAASSRRTTAAKRQQPQVQKAVVSKLIDKLKSM